MEPLLRAIYEAEATRRVMRFGATMLTGALLGAAGAYAMKREPMRGAAVGLIVGTVAATVDRKVIGLPLPSPW